jgi:Ca2+-binding RTX toxin-like protein
VFAGSLVVTSVGAGFIGFTLNGQPGSLNFFGPSSNPTITNFIVNLGGGGSFGFTGHVTQFGGDLSSIHFDTQAARFGFNGTLNMDLFGNLSGSLNSVYVGIGKLQVSLGGGDLSYTNGHVSGHFSQLTIQDQSVAHPGDPYDSIQILGLGSIDVANLDDYFSGVTTVDALLAKFTFAGNDDAVLDFKNGVMFDSGAGEDVITGGRGNDTLIGGDGNDNLTGGPPTIETIKSGDDSLLGGAGNDNLGGWDGNDTFVGGSGNDNLFGDAGNDLADFSDATGAVNGSLATGLVSDGQGGTDTLTSIEGLRGGAFADTLAGSDGDNTLDGGGGADSLAGGAGNDLYVVSDAGATLVELAGGGVDTVKSAVNWTLGANFDNLTLVGSALAGTGNALDNVITGTDGNDTIDGGAGRDTLMGGAGNDTYFIGTGDVVIDTAGNDMLVSSLGLSLSSSFENLTLTMLAGNGAVSGTSAANHLVGNSGSNILNGGDGNDTLEGAGGDDFLFGGSGADRLDGGRGADVMDGGAGNDTYVVSSTRDQIVELAGGGTDTAEIQAARYTLDANVENAVVTREGGSIVTGNGLANRLEGGVGADTLTGGAGADKFVFNDPGSIDRITDFEHGVDKLVLDPAAFAGAVLGDTLIYNAETGALFYNDEQIATLGSGLDHPTLTAGDILIQ